MNTKLIIFLFLSIFVSTSTAQELYGGEIRVKQLATYSVSATVNLFTEIHEELDSIQLCWGDGSCQYLPLIYTEAFPESSVKYHQFEAIHTYGYEDMFAITVDGCCWSERVLNIDQPQAEEFHLSTDFFLSVNDPLFGENFMPSFSRGFAVRGSTSPILSYESNFVDPEGDEVKFEICEIDYVANYFQPTAILASPGNQLFLDTLDGSFVWAAPQSLGKYVLALCVSEYRNGTLISMQTRNIVIQVDEFVGNKEIELAHQIDVFPNPVDNILTIKMAEGSFYNGVIIFDSLGRKVKGAEAVNELDVSGLSKGFYLLQLQVGKQFYNKKIMVSR